MKNKKRKIGLLCCEGDVFSAVRTNNKDEHEFDIIDNNKVLVWDSASVVDVLNMYDGKIHLEHSDGTTIDISSFNQDSKPSLRKLVDFLTT